jgi:endoribonuclease Dicer
LVHSNLVFINYMLSQVYIVEDRNELESFSSAAAIVSKYYDAYLVDFDDLKSRLQILFEEVT